MKKILIIAFLILALTLIGCKKVTSNGNEETTQKLVMKIYLDMI